MLIVNTTDGERHMVLEITTIFQTDSISCVLLDGSYLSIPKMDIESVSWDPNAVPEDVE